MESTSCRSKNLKKYNDKESATSAPKNAPFALSSKSARTSVTDDNTMNKRKWNIIEEIAPSKTEITPNTNCKMASCQCF